MPETGADECRGGSHSRAADLVRSTGDLEAAGVVAAHGTVPAKWRGAAGGELGEGSGISSVQKDGDEDGR